MMPPKDEMRAFLRLKYLPLDTQIISSMPSGAREIYTRLLNRSYTFYTDHMRRSPTGPEFRVMRDNAFIDAYVQYHTDLAIW